MTAAPGSFADRDGARDEARDEAVLAQLFDRLVEDVQEGRDTPEDALLVDRPDLRDRVDELLRLAGNVAGRREQRRPQFEGYSVIRELGRGGMGTVFLARQDDLGRNVALKVLPRAVALSHRARRRFMEEARALASLHDEHVVQIHQVLSNEDALAYTMEWVDGLSLRELLDQLRTRGRGAGIADVAAALGGGDRFREATSFVQYIVRLGIQIARALGKVHEAGLVHRDVKPSNILIRRDGSALLSDFGLVRGGDSSMTCSGVFVGTPVYSPPEQLRGTRDDIDARADVYALGVTLYEAMAFAPPFAGVTTIQVLSRIEEGQLQSLRKLAPEVPRDLETILARALEPDPRDRYASADELADDLERLLRLEPILARPASLARRCGKFMRRHRRSLAAAGLGAVLVAAALSPWIAEAGSKARIQREVRELTDSARLSLLSDEIREEVWRQLVLGHRRPAVHGRSLTAALADYNRALELDPENGRLQLERSVVWLAHRTSQRPRRDLRGDSEAKAMLAALPPLTARLAEFMLAGRGGLPAYHRKDYEGGATSDLEAAGLLAFLTGNFRTCERAWQDLDPISSFPLVNAGLGILYHADGRPKRAYPRLFHTVQTFPAAKFLFVELADIAMSDNDTQLARRWLARAEPKDTPGYRRRCLQADVAYASGDREWAYEEYLRMRRQAPDIPTAYYRVARVFEDRGDLDRATSDLKVVVRLWPQVARHRLSLARLALKNGDLVTYLQQVRYAASVNFGSGRSMGTRRDFAELLRLSGLRQERLKRRRRGQRARADHRRRPRARNDIASNSRLWTDRFGSLQAVEAGILRLAQFDRDGKAAFRIQDPEQRGRRLLEPLSAVSRAAIHLPGMWSPVDARLRPGLLLGAFWLRQNWQAVCRCWGEWMLERDPPSSERPPSVSWRPWHGVSPPQHSDHVLVGTDDGVILFGGSGPGGRLLQQTWRWDGQAWKEIKVTAHPMLRMRHAAAYDQKRRCMVMFGGSATSISGFMNDTWEFDGSRWARIETRHGPSPRNDHAMTYDPDRQRVVLFGGRGVAGLHNDLWEWDGQTWVEVKCANPPPPRHDHCLAYDARRRRLVVDGGFDERHQTPVETHEWDGQRWSGSRPKPGALPIQLGRAGGAMVFDERSGQVVRFGGFGDVGGVGGIGGTATAEVWAWDGQEWSALSLRRPPSGRSGHAMTFDFKRRRVVMFGGWDVRFRADTWEF